MIKVSLRLKLIYVSKYYIGLGEDLTAPSVRYRYHKTIHYRKPSRIGEVLRRAKNNVRIQYKEYTPMARYHVGFDGLKETRKLIRTYYLCMEREHYEE